QLHTENICHDTDSSLFISTVLSNSPTPTLPHSNIPLLPAGKPTSNACMQAIEMGGLSYLGPQTGWHALCVLITVASGNYNRKCHQ
ncbi:hypothetical protein KUCAC02_026092, partial [Chaenocephalus aceratus]